MDFVMSSLDKHQVNCTDFRATLDLFTSEKDNSNVDNHAVVCIFLYCLTGELFSIRIMKTNGIRQYLMTATSGYFLAIQ